MTRSEVFYKRFVCGLQFAALGFIALLPSRAIAADEVTFRFQYAAKFTCGFDPADAFVRVIPGQYATAVGIHNPQSQTVTFRKKIAFVFPPAAERPGRVSDFITGTLRADEALEVDCGEIPAEFRINGSPITGLPPYIQGFLIIETTRSVDVTGTYTAGPTSMPPQPAPTTFSGFATDARVSTTAVEQIRERRIGQND